MNTTHHVRRALCAGLSAVLLLMSGGAVANCGVVSGYPETTPDADFADAGGGTVRHLPTGLTWKRCAEGQTWNGTTCTGSAASYTWRQALDRTEQVNAGAAGTQNITRQTDWRLPNINELGSIVELGCVNPAINTTQFPIAPASAFWSGSPLSNGSTAWSFQFYGGGDGNNNRSSAYHARLVRAGQDFSNFEAIVCRLDVNDDAQSNVNIDGIVILRYLFGIRGAALVAGLPSPLGGNRNTANAIETFISAQNLNVSGTASPATAVIDGIVILRYLLNLNAATMIAGTGINPADAASVRSRIQGWCP